MLPVREVNRGGDGPDIGTEHLPRGANHGHLKGQVIQEIGTGREGREIELLRIFFERGSQQQERLVDFLDRPDRVFLERPCQIAGVLDGRLASAHPLDIEVIGDASPDEGNHGQAQPCRLLAGCAKPKAPAGRFCRHLDGPPDPCLAPISIQPAEFQLL